MPFADVTTWSLEMRDAAELRPRRSERPGLRLVRVDLPAPAFARFLYVEIGRDHEWTDRLPWPEEQWRRWLARPEVELWVLWLRGAPAGYFELERQGEATCELSSFGLLSEFLGEGLGAHLLTAALERAWALPGLRRVWVHTCSLDGPHALANYEARGMRRFREEHQGPGYTS